MPFDVGNLNPAIRFFYRDKDGNETGEWVELQRVPLKQVREFRKKCTKRRIEYKNGQRFEVVDFDDDLWNELTWDEMISSWHLLSNDAEEIECNKENKLMMMLGSVDFLNWINQCSKQMTVDIEIMTEESEKN